MYILYLIKVKCKLYIIVTCSIANIGLLSSVNNIKEWANDLSAQFDIIYISRADCMSTSTYNEKNDKPNEYDYMPLANKPSLQHADIISRLRQLCTDSQLTWAVYLYSSLKQLLSYLSEVTQFFTWAKKVTQAELLWPD